MTAKGVGQRRQIGRYGRCILQKLGAHSAFLPIDGGLKVADGDPARVIGHDVHNRQVILHGSRQLLSRHQEITVAQQSHDLVIRRGQFGAQRGRNRPAHRAETTGGQVRVGFVDHRLLEPLRLGVARRGEHDGVSIQKGAQLSDEARDGDG